MLLTLAGLHVAAILAYWLCLRIDRVSAMITGRRKGADPAAGIAGNRLLLALAVAAVAGGAVWLMLALAPEPATADFFF